MATKRVARPLLQPTSEHGATIQLQSPTQGHHEAFVVGNALKYAAARRIAADVLPVADAVLGEPYGDVAPVVQRDSAKGQHLVLCGAGPSLKDNAAAWCPEGDQVWGCNSALTYLHEHGHKVTHGFAIDQTADMLQEWGTTPDVEYLLATTVHCHLPELLHLRGRRMTFFHNFVGIRKPNVSWPDVNGVQCAVSYEQWLYNLLYPYTVQAGSGLNSVTRALDLAVFMGFEKISVLGADCAMQATQRAPKGAPVGSPRHRQWLRNSVTLHADGGHGLTSNSTPTTLEAKIDGRYWVTKPDMVISAGWLVDMALQIPGCQLIGDTFPNMLLAKQATMAPEAWERFRARLPELINADGTVTRYSYQAIWG